MCLVQIKQAQIKFPLSGFWTVWKLTKMTNLLGFLSYKKAFLPWYVCFLTHSIIIFKHLIT
jgi:hypothetical protein